jgi:uncharacterized protein YecE (DUF72 family)
LTVGSISPFIGTAGWSIPKANAHEFPHEGSALERYSARFAAVEINSSFHRPHRLSTWQRWRDSVPADFRFSVKLPKLITHERRLVDCDRALDSFVEQAGELGEKLAVLLVQLPPKLAFDASVAAKFFAELALRTSAKIVCEPRHASWFTAEAEQLLDELRVARVVADPAVCENAGGPGGWPGIRYWRLHGSPVIYRSSYGDRITSYAAEIANDAEAGRELWCIFDNTASSAGAGDALALMDALRHSDD